MTPYQMADAAIYGNTEELERALNQGNNINVVDNDRGFTALMWAAEAEKADEALKAAKVLVEKGADVNVIGGSCLTALYIACREGHTELAQFLVKNEAKIDAKNDNGWTPLIVAANNAHYKVVQFLLENGADINTKSNNGKTALTLVKERELDERKTFNPEGTTKTIEILKKHGAIEGYAPKEQQGQHGTVESSGGCFIATAVYGSYNAPEVLLLRQYRDEKLSKSHLGRIFIQLYYKYSPYFANKLKKAPYINDLIKHRLLDKIVEIIKTKR